jgi:hypothetical protein
VVGRISDDYQRGIPSKPYDLLREGLVVLAFIMIVVVVFAIVWSSPDYPTVTAQDVAVRQPLAYLEETLETLAGKSSIQTYGPPYNKGEPQRVAGLAPADIPGVTIPLEPSRDFVLTPLHRAVPLDPAIGPALATYEAASQAQRTRWLTAYGNGLAQAKVIGSGATARVVLPPGNYGPVQTLMDGMLALGRGGLLEGALVAGTPYYPYALDFTRPLLYFQDDVYAAVAQKLNMTGSQWGISNETGNYPGAGWLYPYTFLYQIPPISSSPNADLIVGVIMSVIFLIMLLLPFIPGLNRLPRWLRVYRLIWRDWYRRQERLQD